MEQDTNLHKHNKLNYTIYFFIFFIKLIISLIIKIKQQEIQ